MTNTAINSKKLRNLNDRFGVKKIYLSAPHLTGEEKKYLQEAFDTNWIAPLGPNVDGLEQDISKYTGSKACSVLSSGTAALHLALILLGVEEGDEVSVFQTLKSE